MSHEKLAKFLIQIEIDAGTPTVGPPIDVARISKDGVVWFINNNNSARPND